MAPNEPVVDYRLAGQPPAPFQWLLMRRTTYEQLYSFDREWEVSTAVYDFGAWPVGYLHVYEILVVGDSQFWVLDKPTNKFQLSILFGNAAPAFTPSERDRRGSIFDSTVASSTAGKHTVHLWAASNDDMRFEPLRIRNYFAARGSHLVPFKRLPFRYRDLPLELQRMIVQEIVDELGPDLVVEAPFVGSALVRAFNDLGVYAILRMPSHMRMELCDKLFKGKRITVRSIPALKNFLRDVPVIACRKISEVVITSYLARYFGEQHKTIVRWEDADAAFNLLLPAVRAGKLKFITFTEHCIGQFIIVRRNTARRQGRPVHEDEDFGPTLARDAQWFLGVVAACAATRTGYTTRIFRFHWNLAVFPPRRPFGIIPVLNHEERQAFFATVCASGSNAPNPVYRLGCPRNLRQHDCEGTVTDLD